MPGTQPPNATTAGVRLRNLGLPTDNRTVGRASRSRAAGVSRRAPACAQGVPASPSASRVALRIAEARRYSMVPPDWMRPSPGKRCSSSMRGSRARSSNVARGAEASESLLGRILASLHDERPIFLCDSFEGLPPPEPIDGAAALEWSRDRRAPLLPRQLPCLVGRVGGAPQDARARPSNHAGEGMVQRTRCPQRRPGFGPIALLRIDADWHSSVTCCLEELYDAVVPNGYVIFDDYDTWDGCATAVHEFLGRRRLSHRILHDGCAYFRKG